MKLIIQKLGTVVAMFLMFLSVSAHSFEVAGIYYKRLTDSTVAVSYRGPYDDSYDNEYSGEVVIPESVTYSGNTYSVTSIGESAFYRCYYLTSVTIPNTVTSIGNYAFNDCSGLTLVTIPNSVTSIGDHVFNGCSSLTSVTIPNSVTTIGWRAFNGCSGLTSVTIPNSVTSIGSSAFNGCSGLTSVIIPNSVTSIGDYAFDGCDKLHSLTLGSGLISIGKWTKATANIHYPEKVIWLANTPPSGYYLFQSNVNYVANKNYKFSSGTTYVYDHLSSMFEAGGIVYVPISPSERTCDIIDSSYSGSAANINLGRTTTYRGIEMNVVNVRPYAFYDNDYIKTLIIDRDGAIQNSMFYDCDSLLNLSLSSSISSVGDYSFYSCNNLQKVELDSFLGLIGDYAFSGCSAMIEAKINNSGPIGKYAFSGCSAMTEVKINNSGSIGDYAFSGCSALAEINIRNSGDIGSHAFENCSAAASLTVAPTVTNIGSMAFNRCGNLQKVELYNSGLIGEYAFSGCSAMTEAKINNLGIIGDYAFSGCSALAEINIRSIGTVGSNAFENCSAAVSLTIAPTIAKIDNYAFFGCKSLADVTIEDVPQSANPDSVILTLGSNGRSPLFSDCPLDEVYIGRKLSYSTKSNYGSPFYRNTSLRSVEIADVETKIYDKEFYGCTNLQSVKIGDGVESFGKYSFSGCSKIESFEFGKSVKTIGEEAFSDCTSMKSMTSHNPEPPVCGNEALDDINKWDCTLHVPAESIDAYKDAAQWKEFFFVEEAGVEDVVVDGRDFKIAANPSGMTIEGAVSKRVSIYSISGAKVFETVNYDGSEIPLVNGMYIVTVDGYTAKVKI